MITPLRVFLFRNGAGLGLQGMRHGPAMAGAIYNVQWLDPSRAALRAVNLEQGRVSWHHTPLLMEAMERVTAFRRTIGELPGWAQLQAHLDFVLDFADGIVVMLVQRLVPDAGHLPWLSITTARAAELYGRGSRDESGTARNWAARAARGTT